MHTQSYHMCTQTFPYNNYGIYSEHPQYLNVLCSVDRSPTNTTLFPYGADAGDVLEPFSSDSAFGPVYMDYPIVLFRNRETSFYVS